MSITAVLVTYRTGPILGPAIESLLSQPDLERIVVVNNGNPPDVLAALAELSDREPRVHLLTGHGNVGFARACNLGAALAATPLLFFVNPDCVLAPDALAEMRKAAITLPDPWLLSPRLANPDGTEQRGARRDVLTPWRAVVEWTRLYRLAPRHPYFRPFNQHEITPITGTSPVNVVSGAAMLVKRDTFGALGGFDEGYFLHVEDIDLCIRLMKDGGSAWACPNATIVHHASSSDASPVFIEWHKTRGFARYFRKHFAGVYPPGFLALVIAGVYLRFAGYLPLLVIRHVQHVNRQRLINDTQDAENPDF